MALHLGELTLWMNANTTGFDQKVDRSVQKLDKFAASARKAAAVATVALAAIGTAGGYLIKVASDAEELDNVVDQAFGHMSKEINAWAKDTGKAMGRSTHQMREYAGVTQAMLKPILKNADAAAKMAKEMATLAVDMGSFWNVADEDAFEALRSGIVGMVQPLRRFGIDLSVATLEAWALEKGIKANVATMSDAEKMMLRWQFIMDRTTMVQGDAARTIDSVANMTKALGAEIRNVSEDFGVLLLPVWAEVLKNLRDAVLWFGTLDEKQRRQIIQWGALAAAVLGGVVAFGMIATAAAIAVKAVVAVGALFALATSPFAIGILAFIAAAVAIKTAWDAVSELDLPSIDTEKWGNTWDNIKTTALDTLGSVWGTIKGVKWPDIPGIEKQDFVDGFNTMKTITSDAIGSVSETIKGIEWPELPNLSMKAWSQRWESIKSTVSGTIATINETIDGVDWPALPDIDTSALLEGLTEIKEKVSGGIASIAEILKAVEWPSLPEFKWPHIPDFDWPVFPEFSWPSIPEATSIIEPMQKLEDTLERLYARIKTIMGNIMKLFGEWSWPSVKPFEWPGIPELKWPELPRFEWPAIEPFQWPIIPQFAWPEIPAPQWPELGAFQWPDIPEFAWPIVEPFQWPDMPDIQWPTVPQSVIDSYEKLKTVLSGISIPDFELSEETVALLERLAQAFATTPAGQGAKTVMEVVAEYQAGEISIGEAIKEALLSDLSIPLAGIGLTLLTGGKWRLAIGIGTVFMSLLPESTKQGIKDTVSSIWQWVKDAWSGLFGRGGKLAEATGIGGMDQMVKAIMTAENVGIEQFMHSFTAAGNKFENPLNQAFFKSLLEKTGAKEGTQEYWDLVAATSVAHYWRTFIEKYPEYAGKSINEISSEARRLFAEHMNLGFAPPEAHPKNANWAKNVLFSLEQQLAEMPVNLSIPAISISLEDVYKFSFEAGETIGRLAGELGIWLAQQLTSVEVRVAVMTVALEVGKWVFTGISGLAQGLIEGLADALSEELKTQGMANLKTLEVPEATIPQKAWSVFLGAPKVFGAAFVEFIQHYLNIKSGSFASGTPWTGSGPLNEVAGVVHKQEAVIPYAALKKGPAGVLEFLGVPGFQSGKDPTWAGATTLSTKTIGGVTVPYGASVTEEWVANALEALESINVSQQEVYDTIAKAVHDALLSGQGTLTDLLHQFRAKDILLYGARSIAAQNIDQRTAEELALYVNAAVKHGIRAGQEAVLGDLPSDAKYAFAQPGGITYGKDEYANIPWLWAHEYTHLRQFEDFNPKTIRLSSDIQHLMHEASGYATEWGLAKFDWMEDEAYAIGGFVRYLLQEIWRNNNQLQELIKDTSLSTYQQLKTIPEWVYSWVDDGSYADWLRQRGFESGSQFTGWGPTDEVAGVVHRREAVIPWKALQKGIPGVLGFLGVPGFQAGLPQNISTGNTQIDAMLASTGGWLDSLGEAMSSIIDTIKTVFVDFFTWLGELLVTIAKSFLSEEQFAALENAFNSLKERVQGIADAWSGKETPSTAGGMGNFRKAVDDFMKAQVEVQKPWWKKLFDNIKSQLQDVNNQIKQADWSIEIQHVMSGVVDGLKSSTSEIAHTIAGMVDHIMLALNDWRQALSNVVSMMVSSLVNLFADDYAKEFEKYGKRGNEAFDSFSTMLENYKNWDKNLDKLKQLQRNIDTATVGGGAIGGLIGFLLGGPIGAIIGAGVGAMAGRSAATSASAEEMEELRQKLEDTLAKIKEFLGTTINDIAGAVASAFSAANLSDFYSRLDQNLADIVRNAFINAFVASTLEPLITQLSDVMTQMVMSGQKLSDPAFGGALGFLGMGNILGDMTWADVIKTLVANIKEQAPEFYEILDELGLAFGDLADSANEVTGALRNMPRIFKYALTSHRVELPQYQSGGYVPETGPAYLHQGEYVLTPDEVSNQRAGITVNITGPIYGMDDFERKVEEGLMKAMRKHGLWRHGVVAGRA